MESAKEDTRTYGSRATSIDIPQRPEGQNKIRDPMIYDSDPMILNHSPDQNLNEEAADAGVNIRKSGSFKKSNNKRTDIVVKRSLMVIN